MRLCWVLRVCVCSCGRSVRDFLDQSHAWTEEPILDGGGRVLLDVEAVRQEVGGLCGQGLQGRQGKQRREPLLTL